jgi:aminodeoxyfutalosine synthase
LTHVNRTHPDSCDPLAGIHAKLARRERLTRDDGLALHACPDVLALGRLADTVARRMHGRNVYYVRNGHINYSNSCTFCSFYRRKEKDRRPGGYEMSLEQVFAEAERVHATGATELHIVGGLHPDFPFSYYTDMLRGLRARFPKLGLKCFTAIEIYHLAGLAKRSLTETLAELKDAGLDTLPGGGAEILDDAIRERICKGKETSAEWLELHRQAHRLGIRTNATMLHGHYETPAHRVEHLLKLRELQDETGGFLAFIPLSYHPEGNALKVDRALSGLAELREFAVARLMLDNFPHVKAYWVTTGLDVAQMALRFGATDLDGTVLRERIYHMAGSQTPQGLTVTELERRIREAGCEPVERDHLYRTVTKS